MDGPDPAPAGDTIVDGLLLRRRHCTGPCTTFKIVAGFDS